jgi:hypothetical protein
VTVCGWFSLRFCSDFPPCNSVLSSLHTRALFAVLWQLAAHHPERLRALVFHCVDPPTADVIITRYASNSLSAPTDVVKVCSLRWDDLESIDDTEAAIRNACGLCSECVVSIAAGAPQATIPLTVTCPGDLPTFFDVFYAVFPDPMAVMTHLTGLRAQLSKDAFDSVCASLNDRRSACC